MNLHTLLGIDPAQKEIVSVCGSGGKTTLVFALARESCDAVPSAVFTTTHFRRPTGEKVTFTDPWDERECRAAWERGETVSTASAIPGEERKYGAPPEEVMRFLCREATAVYIEADGSRCMPLKYPAPWEPVIREETTHTVVVAGLSALGGEPEKTIHRLPLLREVMPFTQHTVDEELTARLLWLGYGRFDPVFLLNQADSPALVRRGESIAERLYALGAKKAVVTSLKKHLQPTP